MHMGLIVLAIAVAWAYRYPREEQPREWRDRWRTALRHFLLPPLLLLMTAIATLCMGTQGQMFGVPVGWIGFSVASAFLLWTGLSLGWMTLQAGRSLHQLRTFPCTLVQGRSGYLVDFPIPFAAQIGLWQPRLVVSQSLLDTLSAEQVEAVLQHEDAHARYRDPFWFFWLGWIRHLTAWLPQTECLWQELLLLRELRADQWATQRVDPLTLAEALLTVVAAPAIAPPSYGAAFSAIAPAERLEERVNALLMPPTLPQTLPVRSWLWIVWSLLPLGLVMLHS